MAREHMIALAVLAAFGMWLAPAGSSRHAERLAGFLSEIVGGFTWHHLEVGMLCAGDPAASECS